MAMNEKDLEEKTQDLNRRAAPLNEEYKVYKQRLDNVDEVLDQLQAKCIELESAARLVQARDKALRDEERTRLAMHEKLLEDYRKQTALFKEGKISRVEHDTFWFQVNQTKLKLNEDHLECMVALLKCEDETSEFQRQNSEFALKIHEAFKEKHEITLVLIENRRARNEIDRAFLELGESYLEISKARERLEKHHDA